MTHNVWLDDVRSMPEGYDFWAKTPAEAWHYLADNDMYKDLLIDFDHDLGCHYSGYDLAKMIEIDAHNGLFPNRIVWKIHSQNPVGRKNIEMAMISADKAWDLLESES